MDPITFAKLHLGPHKVRGSEIVPQICPFCKGGTHRERDTFALNVDKLTYNCRRASCNQTGTFWQLCKEFGEEADRTDNQPPPKPKVYKQPNVQTKQPGSKAVEYLQKRGFSRATWERRKVAEVNGAIAMPYFENGQIVFMKYRTPEKPSKHWREPDGKPVFWGMELCQPDLPLVIVEGEMDALALDEAGIPNVVSVPSGASDLTCIENCWTWLEQFKKIVLWGDNDAPGKEMVDKLILRLGVGRCYIAESPFKDANIHLYKLGKESCKKVVEEAKEVPVAGIKRLSEVKRLDFSKIQAVRSGIRQINKILGGWRMGEVTVWTGINSSGKSTFLGQEMIEAVNQNFPVFVYSGELIQSVFKDWLHLQMAGPNHVTKIHDHIREREVFRVNDDIAGRLEKWYNDLFFLYDSYTADESKLFELCEIAVRRYDCKMFLLDNLMTANVEASSNPYQAQSEFVGKAVKFAKRFGVHIFLVAHPKKQIGKLTKMDISGSADISNRADNVLGIHRFSLDEKLTSEYAERYKDLDGLLQVFKNRFDGPQGMEVGLKFDDSSKRFYSPNEPGTLLKAYSWEYEKQTPLGEEVQIKAPWD